MENVKTGKNRKNQEKENRNNVTKTMEGGLHIYVHNTSYHFTNNNAMLIWLHCHSILRN